MPPWRHDMPRGGSSAPVRRSWNPLQAVALVGTHVPRRCGIGTFTSDLSEAIAAVEPRLRVRAIAMNDRPEGYRYPPRVSFEINQNRLGEYRLAADYLNLSGYDVCCVQHEYGIFGGPEGAAILDFIKRLRMPVVSTLHTVLKTPSDAQRDVVVELAQCCERLVVMADRAVEFLTKVYGLPADKVELIPHGIPDVPFVDPNFYKDQFGVEGKKTILTFGLLGPSKGLEHMIEAMPRIVAEHPDAVYMIVGATHPGVLAHSGEEYRLGLQRRAKELGVADHIQWFNKFVEMDELVEFLGAADVYVTPYQNEAQITSGTLAYALGTGKAVVSTPYWHAAEMLAEERGRLVPFNDVDALSSAINGLLANDVERHAVRKRAYTYTRQMRWQDVASRYLQLFSEVREERNRHPRPAMHTGESAAARRRTERPEVKLDHLRRLTDDTGLLRAARATIPHRQSGYTTDDNARALIVTMMAQDHQPYDPVDPLDTLASRYLSFLDDAFDSENGRFRNELSYDRRWADGVGSEDCHGRAVWALGEVVARSQQRGQMLFAASLLHKALPACEHLHFDHGMAYSLIGIHAYLRRFSGDSHARRVRETLAHRLQKAFAAAETQWMWPTDTLTYASAVLPQALLLSGRWLFDDAMIQLALRALEWLHEVQGGDASHFAPIGTQGWYPRGGVKARFDQLPIEAAVTIEAHCEAYRVTRDRKWYDRAERTLNWFLGDNDLRVPLYDPHTGGCHDALMAQGVSENQSAESTLAWLMSLMSLLDEDLGLKSDDTKVQPTPDRKTTPDGEPIDPRLPEATRA